MANRNAAKKTIDRIASVLLGAALALFAACANSPPYQTGAGGAGAGGGGGLEEIVVTGARVERRDRPSDRYIVRQQQTPLAAAAVAPGQAEPAGRLFAGMRPGGSTLLSQVQPGEELWVIQTVTPETATDDSSPGSGTMLALVAPSSGAAPTEVPLPLRHTDVRAIVDGLRLRPSTSRSSSRTRTTKRSRPCTSSRCPRRPPSTSS